jgi:hypothetical protein
MYAGENGINPPSIFPTKNARNTLAAKAHTRNGWFFVAIAWM